jgi:hypothetical protein
MEVVHTIFMPHLVDRSNTLIHSSFVKLETLPEKASFELQLNGLIIRKPLLNGVWTEYNGQRV